MKFLFLFRQHLCKQGSVYLHSAEGAELLTAEAFYALFAVDHGLAVDHFYCLSGADLLALFTTAAFLLRNVGLCLKCSFCDLAEEL